MAARWHMRWRAVSQSSEQPVRVLLALSAMALALAAAATAAPANAAIAVGTSTTAGTATTAAALAAPATVDTVTAGAAAAQQIAKPSPAVALNPSAFFKHFEYTGHDSVFVQPAGPGTYRNPVLAGFYPDPSITQANGKFYLVNSTFTFFPGLPIFASRDLVHWRQIGNVIDRPRELNFDNQDVSRGIFAPTIRYNKGLFYLITTDVDAGGNEIFVAKNPAGPWSDPFPLPGLEGDIDPSLFFDSDGKAYVLNNGLPPGGSKYEGHRAIWIQQFDTATRKLVGPRKMLINGGIDPSKKPIWIEGPHLYRHDGWYILMCAEGGTRTQHSEVVLRSKSPWGPFKPYKGNPILTQRDLPADRPDPVINAGHADLVEAPDGSWWAVFLASRAYDQVHYNTGRETFMLPVTWQDGWPTILAQGEPIPYVVEAPKSASEAAGSAANAAADVESNAGPAPAFVPTTGNFTWRDDFTEPALPQQWLYVRTPVTDWADLAQRPGWLTIHALHVPLESKLNPSFLARRQQHLTYDASTELELPVATEGSVSAGLVAFQNQDYWFFLGVRRKSPSQVHIFLEKRAGNQTETVATADVNVASQRADVNAASRADVNLGWQRADVSDAENTKQPLPARPGTVLLKISAQKRDYSFYFNSSSTGWKPLKEHEDGSILSTNVAGGFVGATVGPYARAE